VPVLHDRPHRTDGLGRQRENAGGLEESRVTVRGRGLLAAKLVDEVVVAEDDHPGPGMGHDGVVAGLPQGSHVTALAVAGEHEDPSDARAGELAENALHVSFELGHGKGDGAGKASCAGRRTVGDRGGYECVHPLGKGRRRRLGLDLVGAEREMRSVGLQRADRDDHERVRREPTLERARVELEKTTGGDHDPNDEATVFNAGREV